MARALGVPLYQLFYDGEEPPTLPNLSNRNSCADLLRGSSGKEARLLKVFRRLLSRMETPTPSYGSEYGEDKTGVAGGGGFRLGIVTQFVNHSG